MHEAEDADADHAPHTSPAAAHVLVQLSPRSPACQLNPWPPHVTSTGGEVGGGGERGDGGGSGDGGSSGGGGGGDGGGDGGGGSHGHMRTALPLLEVHDNAPDDL